MEKKYITLKDLSYRLGLSGNYLRDLAKDGKIPSLNVNGRLRFNSEAVQTALDGLAAKGECHEE